MKHILTRSWIAASLIALLGGCQYVVDHDEDRTREGVTSTPKHQEKTAAKPKTPTKPKTPSAPLKWLEGCWSAVEGDGRETWTLAGLSHAFGTSVVMEEGRVLFFEQMVIDRKAGADGYVFHAYPAGIGPTSFPQQNRGSREITFANAAHDYPQLISYARKGQKLTAHISMIDGKKSNHWEFEPCK